MKKLISLLIYVAICLSCCGSAVTGAGLGATSGSTGFPQNFQVNQLISDGQSLSIGFEGICQSNTQYASNTKLTDSLGYYWANLTNVTYPLNSLVFQNPPLGSLHQWKATTGGTPGGTEPSWPASPTVGVTTVSDGSVVWTYQGLAANYPFQISLPNSATLGTGPNICSPAAGNNIAPYNLVYHANVLGEDVGLDAADEFTHLVTTQGCPTVLSSFVINDTAVGVGGASLAQISSGGAYNSYAAWQFEANALVHLKGSGNVGIFAKLFTHGETDFANASYATQVKTFSDGIDTDAAAIFTWQTTKAAMVFSQQNGFPAWYTGPKVSDNQQVAMAINYPTMPGRMVGSDAVYPFQHAGAGDPHLTGAGYRMLGEKDGEAMCAAYGDGRWNGNWSPVVPTSTVLSGGNKVITVTYSVKFPPLQFINQDLLGNTIPEPHPGGGQNAQWSGAQGYEATDLATTVASASLATTPITITMAANLGWNASGDKASTPCGTWPVTVSGNVLTITGSTGNVTCNSWQTGTGAIVVGNTIARAQAITSVSVANGNQIVITLTNTPSTGLQWAYGWTPDNVARFTTGGMEAGNDYGFVYDSDPFVGVKSGKQIRGSAFIYQSGALL
jgi:hypothetical protein